MTELTQYPKIDPATLRPDDYFASLLAAAQARELVTEQTVIRLQGEALSLLAAQTNRLTRGGSTSVRTETAQALAASVFYTVGLALKAYPTPDDALCALTMTPLAQIWQAGQVEIARKRRMVEFLYTRLKNRLFATPNVFYRATLHDGIAGFLKCYRPALFAQEISITLDYPLCLPTEHLCGIERVEQYLRYADAENRFCLCFPAEKTHVLLQTVCPGYEQIPLNLYETVATAALCAVLNGNPARSFACSRTKTEALLQNRSVEQIATLLEDALFALAEQISCPESVCAYVRQTLPTLAAHLSRAQRLGHLETVLPFAHTSVPVLDVTVAIGPPMPDFCYRAVLQRLTACTDAAEKLRICKESVQGFGDLAELLAELCETDADFSAFLALLPEETLAALMAADVQESSVADVVQPCLRRAVQVYVQTLPAEKQEQIALTAKRVRFEPFL